MFQFVSYDIHLFLTFTHSAITCLPILTFHSYTILYYTYIYTYSSLLFCIALLEYLPVFTLKSNYLQILHLSTYNSLPLLYYTYTYTCTYSFHDLLYCSPVFTLKLIYLQILHLSAASWLAWGLVWFCFLCILLSRKADNGVWRPTWLISSHQVCISWLLQPRLYVSIMLFVFMLCLMLPCGSWFSFIYIYFFSSLRLSFIIIIIIILFIFFLH